MRLHRHALNLLGIAAFSLGQAQAQEKDKLSSYLVDVGSGAVTAGSIVGLSESAITNIQSSQDLILAVKPFTSGGSKTGYGLAITPARTSITPMSGKAYLHDPFMRFIGAATLSYAEGNATISDATYNKMAASIDTTYYLKLEDDPIYLGYRAFLGCQERKEHQENARKAAVENKPDVFKAEMEAATAAEKTCQDNAQKKTKWNASRLSLYFAAGWIKPDSGPGSRQSLGRTVGLSGVFGLGETVAAYLTARRSVRELDTATLGATPSFKNSHLVALRLATDSTNGADLRWLIEGSNANSSTATTANAVYKYALGIDKKVYPGVWLEFRVGRNRTTDGTSNQTTALLNLNWAPTSTLFGK